MSQDYARVAAWMTAFQAWSHRQLAASPEALRYLKGRSVTATQIQTFGLGYFPREGETSESEPPHMDWIPQWRSARKGTPWEALHVWLEAYLPSPFRRLRGSVVFPIRDPLGGLLGFQCRQIEQKLFHRYYLPRAAIFPALLGLPEALPHIVASQRIILTEGLFDWLALQGSFPEAVCLMTARLTPSQAEGVLAFAREVVFVLDQDAQGRRGSDLAEELLRDMLGGPDGLKTAGLSFQRWSHPGKDLSEYLSKVGRERFERQFREQDFGVLFRDR